MTEPRLLIANRGEIAVRIMRSWHGETVAVAPADDAASLHARRADRLVELPGNGVAAYLDSGAVLAAAADTGTTHLHPGYGFLAEDATFAAACADAGITFVGPSAEAMQRLGDKVAARALALEIGVPVAEGTDGAVTAEEALAFATTLGRPVMVKAAGGGGGRGMAEVHDLAELTDAVERCASEAERGFGDARVFVEELLHPARHVEVQVLGDGTSAVVLGDRDCSLQRRRQKIVELAPADVTHTVRDELHRHSIALAEAVGYRSLCTFEFLVGSDDRVVFIEANTRVQVEHTITEELTGLDLVALQFAVADGATLEDLGLTDTVAPRPRHRSVQVRVNAERLDADGAVLPASGTVERFTTPSGPGIRVETSVATGDRVSGRYDPMIAKLVVTAPDEQIDRRLGQALAETTVDGVDTNLDFVTHLLATFGVAGTSFHTTFVEAHASELLATMPERDRSTTPAGAAAPDPTPADDGVPLGTVGIASTMVGVVVSVDVAPGDEVPVGAQVAVLESMKMEHLVVADRSGIVREVRLAAGDLVDEGSVVVVLEPAEILADGATDTDDVDLDHIRPDLAEVVDRHEIGLDHRRPDAVEKRHAKGRRTARENVADLLDEGSFVEYGALVLAAQRRRRSLQELIEKTPGDGLVGGIGTVDADRFDDGRVAVMSYDYTVLAGTQGGQNHRKKDRLFELAERWDLPVVVFAEGGGGRPGDTDGVGVAGLDCLAFWYFAELSGRVPLVGVNSGYCFAGNAALLGMCDVIISTRDANLGMGGPAMIEGGGLGVFHPSEVGPVEDQWANGVIDVLVDDDEQAVAVAKQYLSYFRGPVDDWEAHDERLLRHVIPENRLRMYDVREVVELLADVDSVLELRAGWGPGMVTALARIEGRPVGIVANDPSHLAGAIDSDGADKASRFMQLCDSFGLPILFLCDTPGIMVGPDAERTGTVRHAARMFVAGASLRVPFVTVILRKGYGLGAQAMAGGSFKAPVMTVSWPTGEFGGMGLEGAVQLGYRNELAAIEDPGERQAAYEQRVAHMYEIGKALNFASVFEIDDVIDPADTRRVVLGAFDVAGDDSLGRDAWGTRPMVDPY